MNTGRLKARLIGLGSYLPKQILTNCDLEKMVDTSDEWIVSRTGIRERRIAGENESPSDMGLAAAKTALEHSGLSAQEIDMILVATMTPDYPSPSTAALIQSRLSATNAAAVDIQAACTGYLYGLSMAKAYIESGMYRNVLLIATEKMSSIIDYQDRNTCILFGDGASASVVSSKGAGLAIETVCLGADGELAKLVIIPGGGACHPTTSQTLAQRMHYFKMEGKEVFKQAVRRMGLTARDCLAQAGINEEKISWLIPHQANQRIIDALAKNFNISDDKVYKTIHKYGNTSASSVAIALEELVHTHSVENGEYLLLAAFGAGLTWGASLLIKVSGDCNE